MHAQIQHRVLRNLVPTSTGLWIVWPAVEPLLLRPVGRIIIIVSNGRLPRRYMQDNNERADRHNYYINKCEIVLRVEWEYVCRCSSWQSHLENVYACVACIFHSLHRLDIKFDLGSSFDLPSFCCSANSNWIICRYERPWPYRVCVCVLHFGQKYLISSFPYIAYAHSIYFIDAI